MNTEDYSPELDGVVDTKQCTKCLTQKPFNEFSRNSKNKDGYRYACKSCEKKAAAQHYRKNADKIKGQVVSWQAQNAEKTKEYKRDYYRRTKTSSQNPKQHES